VLIDRGAGGLHDEDIGPADVLVDLERDFGVGKPPQTGLPERDPQVLRDLLRQFGVRAPRKTASGRQIPTCSHHS